MLIDADDLRQSANVLTSQGRIAHIDFLKKHPIVTERFKKELFRELRILSTFSIVYPPEYPD